MVTLESSHMYPRKKVFGAILNGEPMPKPSTPTESFWLLSWELQSSFDNFVEITLNFEHIVSFFYLIIDLAAQVPMPLNYLRALIQAIIFLTYNEDHIMCIRALIQAIILFNIKWRSYNAHG